MGSPRSGIMLAVALMVAAGVSSVTGGGAAEGSNMLSITNTCANKIEVWPSSPAPASFVELAPGQGEVVPVPPGWSGRVWARALCSSKQDCAAAGGLITVTDGSGGMLHDVSLVDVDGFSLRPVMVAPQSKPQGGGNSYCAPTGCTVDMNGNGVVGASTPQLRFTYAVTFCPASTTSTTNRVLYVERAAGGGGTIGAPSIGAMPPNAVVIGKKGISTAGKIGIGVASGALATVGALGAYYVYRRRYLRQKPEEEVVDDEESLARVSTTVHPGDSSGRSSIDSLWSFHSSPGAVDGDGYATSSPDDQHFKWRSQGGATSSSSSSSSRGRGPPQLGVRRPASHPAVYTCACCVYNNTQQVHIN